MANIRIHELAKELGVESKKVIEMLEKKGVTGKTASSGVDEAQASDIRAALKPVKSVRDSQKTEAGSTAETPAAPQKTARTEAAAKEKPEQADRTAEKGKAASAENTAKENKPAPDKPVKKKKRLIAVFHPQNASSKEGRNFRQGGAAAGKDRNGRPAGRDGRNGIREDRNHRVVAEGNRGGKPVGNGPKKTGTPLVHVPRPHGVIRNENPKPPVTFDRKPEEKKVQPVQEEVLKTQPAAAEVSAAQAASAAEAQVKAAEQENAAVQQQEYPAASAGENTSSVPAAAASAGAESAEENRPETRSSQPQAANANAGGETAAGKEETRDRQNHGAHSFQGRSENKGGGRNDRNSSGTNRNGGFARSDRNDRQTGSNGQGRNFSGRNDRGGSGQGRSFGQGRTGQNGGRQGFGGRPGQGGARPGFSGKPGQGRFGGKDKDEEGSNRFASRGRNQRNEHKGAAPMDVGIKKTVHDSHSRDKDKNKEDLRGNKFTNDRRQGNGHNRQFIPKALQKPVHHKDEKKEEKVTEIKIPDKLTIRELAEKMKMQPSVIVKDLFMKGEMFTVNQEVDFDKAEEIAMSYDILCDHEEQVDVIAEMLKEDEEDESKMVPRPPVVCVMGHVDHGKTSLLDAIRHAHVTDREAGGITQNIGAYSVQINGRKITFLDTPGHEAFTAMRMRGANATDIAVLVVAADDGVMPQTIEAINHAKAANVEIIVAINKIDKPGANVDRVKQELTEYGLVASDWGGQTEMVEVSAKTKQGIDDLLETILLTADIMELKANPDRLARGIVLEAKLDKGKGPVANLLVQKGTLHVGDYIACGSSSGKVRAMTDENGKRVRSAGPSTPVEVQGLDGVPDAGEVLVAMETDKEAKNFAATYVNEHKNQLLEETKSRMSLDALFDQIQDGSVKELEIVLKADVQGSVEALRQALMKLSNDEVVIKIIHAGVGAINESDISLAAASNAIVIGFNVRPDQTAKALADEEKVDVRLYRVIYAAIDDITNAMNGMLEPIYEEKVIGHAEIRQLFKASGVGTIGGSMVLDGVVQRNCKARITRGGKQIFDGSLASLKRFKDDVKEVRAGYECGLVFEGFNDLQEGDQVEAYAMVEVPRDQMKKNQSEQKE